MIGKVIGTIMVIVFFLGILYSIGQYQQRNQEQSGQEQISQEENKQEKKQKESSQEENSQENRKSNTGPVSAGRVDLRHNGQIERINFEVHAYGTVGNDGNKDANNVIVQIIFYRDHIQIDEKKIRVGDVAAGDQRDYDERFTLDSSRYPEESRYRVQYD